MDILRQFFDLSTIHGLSHISNFKGIYAKIFWVAVVITGFLSAGLIVKNSMLSWDENPVVAMIETLPIASITFPR